MTRGKRRRLVPSSSVRKRKKIDWTERLIRIIQKYPSKIPSGAVSEQKKDYNVLNNFKERIFRKKLKGKLPEELIEAFKDCPWFLLYFYSVKVDWTERIIEIIRKYPSKIPSRNVSEQKKDYGVLTSFKQNIFKKKLPEELIEASKDCSWFISYLYPVKVNWIERIIGIIQKYPLKIPLKGISEQQKKDYEVLNSFKQHIFRKKLKGKLPEELIETSKKSPWFLLWLFF